MAGGIGGLIGDSCMYPLDTVKTRQQAAPNALKYKSTTQAFLNLTREEGVFRGLYGGYTPAALGSFPATMSFFIVYESSKRLFINDWNLPEPVAHFTSGLLGDLASSFIYVPSEVLKTRLQLQGRPNNPYFYSGYNYNSMTDAIKTIIRTEGYGALFYGYKATLIRDLPFSAIQFACYEKVHDMAQNYVGRHKDMGVGLELFTGGLAGGFAGATTTPLDVVKTRIQTQHNPETSAANSPQHPTAATTPTTSPNTNPITRSGSTNPLPLLKNVTAANPAASSSVKHYSISSSGTHTAAQSPVILTDSVLHGLKIIYKTEGVRGLFGGIWPRVVWTSVQSSVMLLVYQSVLKYLEGESNGVEPILK